MKVGHVGVAAQSSANEHRGDARLSDAEADDVNDDDDDAVNGGYSTSSTDSCSSLDDVEMPPRSRRSPGKHLNYQKMSAQCRHTMRSSA